MNSKRNLGRWIQYSFIFFMLAAVLGVIMRLAFIVELPEWLKYRNVTHAHSHIAMMGWLYTALLSLIVYYFSLYRRIYKFLFWGSLLTSIGMLISFPIQGYGLFSITFTSLHLLFSYVFIYSVFRDMRSRKRDEDKYSTLFLKTSLLFLFLSTLGTWMLGIIMSTSLKGSALYYGSIQFFLHFQFNGWFIFALISIFLKLISSKGIKLQSSNLWRFYLLLSMSCVLTYALAVTWSTPDKIIFWVNSIGVIIQFLALLLFLKMFVSIKKEVQRIFSRRTFRLLGIVLICMSLKIIVQTMVAIPYLATMSYTVKNFVIGFIHLLMLGGVSTFIIALYNHIHPQTHSLYSAGLSIFLIAFVGSELLLFGQGLLILLRLGFMPAYYFMIFLISLIMAVGIILMGIFSRLIPKVN